ncbi:MAG: DUF1116 domain-containing protein [Candidatus Bipolaricaulota bacterium]
MPIHESHKPARALFEDKLRVVNLGLDVFGEALRAAGAKVILTDWRPPAGGDVALAESLDRLRDDRSGNWREPIAAANRHAADRLLAARPLALGLDLARSVVPGMNETLVLHAGPPVTWERMCGPQRGAVIGALLYEGLAEVPEEAERLAASGEIAFEPCHDHATVGPMAGVVTASMPVWIVENATYGNRAFCTLNEGLGKVLRYGAYAPEVIERLRWMRDVLAPTLHEALLAHGPLDLRMLIGQALQMGDEGHNRNRAATSLLIRELAPHLVDLGRERGQIRDVLNFLHGNDHFALNLTMPAAKCALDAAAGIPGSSMVTAMSRNGTEFGIRVSGTGARWFVAPAPRVEGLYFPGFSAEDAALDLGDSAITEAAGYGGMAMAAAPAIVQFVGGSPELALEYTREMYAITLAENLAYLIPALGFRGTPTGVDVLKVVDEDTVPLINTGIAHRAPGMGMIGAGLVRPPLACFLAAAWELIRTLPSLPDRAEEEGR